MLMALQLKGLLEQLHMADDAKSLICVTVKTGIGRQMPKPCNSGTVLTILPCYRGVILALKFKEDPFILKPISPSCQVSLVGTHTVHSEVKPSCIPHKGCCEVVSCGIGC
jgi:hypothetical protein